MSKSRLGIAIALFALALGASIFFTANPYISSIHYGGCIDTVATTRTPSSLIFEYASGGGHAKKTYPDTSQAEYGCALTVQRAVIPVDLYLLTLVFAIASIWAWRTR